MLTTEGEPRAEELIAEIYRQKQEQEDSGKHPTHVCLPFSWIRRIRVYRLLLGALADGELDYLTHDGVFGLEFVLHDQVSIIVE